jgi:hypothetical protein
VKEYFLERKKQEKINANILNIKYGMDYIGADPQDIQNYENQNLNNLTSGISDIEMSFHDIISQNIPKKMKKPEFQVINDIKSDGKEGREKNSNFTNFGNSSNFSSNQNFSQNMHISQKNEKDTFSYSSLGGSPNSNPTSNQLLPSRIEDVKQIPTLISFMKKETKLEPKLQISNILSKIDSFSLLDRFVQLNGNVVLGYWIDDCKEVFESNDKVDSRIFTLLTNVLNFCDSLPITVNELKTSKIGKKINKLGKCVSDRLIKTKCEELVSKWKKIIENIKDKKGKDRDREKEDSYISHSGSGHKEKEGYSHFSHSSSHRHKTSQSTSNSRHSPSPDHSLSKKTKRDEKYGNSHSSTHNDNFYSSSTTTELSGQTDKTNKKYITIPYLFLYTMFTMFIKFTHNSLSHLSLFKRLKRLKINDYFFLKVK